LAHPQRVPAVTWTLVLWTRATSHGWRSLRSANDHLDGMD
jgi:hypothetical protein